MSIVLSPHAANAVAVPNSGSLRLIAPFACLHAAMFAYGVVHPDRFIRADRGTERMDVMQAFIPAAGSGDLVSFLVSHGVPGDWLPHALLFAAGGAHLVVLVQVLLALLSILWVRDIGRAAGLGEAQSTAAAVLYGLLPHTIVFPHTLATEALFCPLVIAAFRLSMVRPSVHAGLAFGLSVLVRPITLLWPIIQVAVQRPDPRRGLAFLAAAASFPIAWMALVWIGTGELSMGRSGHDLGNNLYNRMHRLAAPLPAGEHPPVRPPGKTKATTGDYLAYAAAHPQEAAAHHLRDVATLMFKSGIERLTIDHFDLFPGSRSQVQQNDGGWRSDVERRGVLAALVDLFAAQPWLVATSLLGALLCSAFIGLALAGAVSWGRTAASPQVRQLRWLLIGFVLYIFVTAQAVDAAQSRHRAPAEFALALLAIAGVSALRRSKEHRHGR